MKFTSDTEEVGGIKIIRVPKAISQQLRSRGMVLVECKIDENEFKIVLEPDGKGGHWFECPNSVSGPKLQIELEQSEDWPQPQIPIYLQTALKSDKKANKLWQEITPMAKWDWIRWIRSTSNQSTRNNRINVAMDKLGKGTRRPCCFNRTMCTYPEICKSGVLLDA